MGKIPEPSYSITQKLSCHEEDDDDQNYAYAAQISDLLTFPMVLQTVMELDLFGIIAPAGPKHRQLSAAEIAAALPGARNPNAAAMLDRLLFLWATYSVVDDGGFIKRKYGLTPITKFFIPNDDGVSFGPMVSFNQDPAFLVSWSKLKEAVLEGGTAFNRVHGMNVFEYQGRNPRFNQMFIKAMYNQSTYIVSKIVRRYKGFDHIHKLVDVGGGIGHSLRAIVSHYPSIKGVNYDLPRIIEHALPISGVEHVTGDMFKSVPKGDAIFMKWILHDWSDKHCVKILKKCYEALPEKGKVIVVERAMEEEPKTTSSARYISQTDVFMMVHISHGGKERTMKEFESLAMAAGFTHFNIACYVSLFWVMEFLK